MDRKLLLETRMLSRRIKAVSAAAVIVLVCACGREEGPALDEPAIDTAAARAAPPAAVDTAPASPAAALDPCTLITTAQLQEITGLFFAEGALTSDDRGFVRCSWVPRDSSKGGVAIAVSSVDPDGTWKKYFAMPGTESVASVGDEAIVNRSLQHFVVRSGDHITVIDLNLEQGSIRPSGEAIARIVVPKISPRTRG